jgi:hypothetical protein
VISPYAKAGYVDHQILSSDAYLKFIEDDFLGGERLDPRTDGRPDLRPDVRENAPILGNLVRDFDVAQPPRPPVLPPVDPCTTLVERPRALPPGVRHIALPGDSLETGQMRRSTVTTFPRMTASVPSMGSKAGLCGSSQTSPPFF